MSEWTGKCCPSCGALPCHWTDPPAQDVTITAAMIEAGQKAWLSRPGRLDADVRAIYLAMTAIVDTHRMAETPKDGSVRSMGGGGADRQSPDTQPTPSLIEIDRLKEI